LAYIKKKRVSVCGTQIKLVDIKGVDVGYMHQPTDHITIRKGLLRVNYFIHPTLMFKRSIFEKVGFYDEDFYRAQDYELMLRITSQYKVGNLPETLMDYLYDTDSISSNPKKRREQDRYALKARWYAITRYGYYNLIDFMIGVVEYLTPFFVKKIILSFIGKKNVPIKLKAKRVLLRV